jgi:hypothetical protein
MTHHEKVLQSETWSLSGAVHKAQEEKYQGKEEKTTVRQVCESRWYNRTDIYESFYASCEDIENIVM